MLKILLLIVVFATIYLIFFKKRKVEHKSSESKNSKHPQVGEELIPCYKCGTLVVESDTFIHNGEQFCSRECAGV
jgi:uncharacterized protein